MTFTVPSSSFAYYTIIIIHVQQKKKIDGELFHGLGCTKKKQLNYPIYDMEHAQLF